MTLTRHWLAWIGAATLVAGAAVAPRARACDCDEDLPVAIPIPPSGSTVPRNARLRVLLTVPLRINPARLAKDWSAISVVCVPTSGGEASRVDVDIRQTVAYKAVLTEAIPRQLLPARSECAWVGTDGSVIGWARVSASVDEDAPVWRGIYRGRAGTRGYGEDGCQDGSGSGYIEMEPPVDDTTSKGHELYAIWFREDGEAIDYEQAPTAWLPAMLDVRGAWSLGLHGGGVCNRGGDFPFPAMGGRGRLGIRAVDFAGRASVQHEAWLQGEPSEWQFRQMGSPENPRSYASFVPLHPADRTPPSQPRRSVRFWILAAALAGASLVMVTALGIRLLRRKA